VAVAQRERATIAPTLHWRWPPTNNARATTTPCRAFSLLFLGTLHHPLAACYFSRVPRGGPREPVLTSSGRVANYSELQHPCSTSSLSLISQVGISISKSDILSGVFMFPHLQIILSIEIELYLSIFLAYFTWFCSSFRTSSNGYFWNYCFFVSWGTYENDIQRFI